MIKASALYMSVIVSLVIVLVCGAILMASYIIGLQHQGQKRAFILRNNLESGIQLVLSSNFPADSSFKMSLYENSIDSVLVSKAQWGLYELGKVTAWINGDTLTKSFLIATTPDDSAKVLFLADEDRPMSISGASLIKGTAYLPKAGIKAAYVNGSSYHEQKLVHGPTKNSYRDLPALLPAKFKSLRKVIRVGQSEVAGMIFLRDSVIIIPSDFKGRNALLVAKSIKIPDNFSGQLQAIATDSIIIGNGVKLSYPSALVIMKDDTAGFQTHIKLGSNCKISGQVISYEQTRSQRMPLISIGEHSVIEGEVWSKGYVNFSKRSKVDGAISAIRLMAKVDGSLYENYLIDVELDVFARSPYYLSTNLINTRLTNNKILCWLN
jgi:hypothetical protein